MGWLTAATRRLPLVLLGLAAIAVSTLTGAAAGSSTTQTFAAAADAYVSSSSPTANFGSDTTLAVDDAPNTNSNARVAHAYLKFDVEGLDAPVTSATLRLYALKGDKGGVDISAVPDNSWSEDGITWENAPASASSVTSASGDLTAGQWVSVDVTPLVSGNGPVSIELRSASSLSPIEFASREDGAEAPQLVVETAAVPPSNQEPPSVNGTSQVGDRLTASAGTWAGTEPIAFAYQWQLCDLAGDSCSDINGATDAEYVVGQADVGSTLRVVVTASNAAGSSTATSVPTNVVSAPAVTDTSPPTAPTGLAVTAVTTTTIALSWSASTDDVGVAGYDVYLNGSKVDTTGQTGYSFGGLTCGTTYTLGVVAFDAAGNRSSESSVSAPSANCANTSPPAAPTGLAVTGTTTSTIALSWSASTDDVGVAGYDVYLNGSKVDTTTQTSYSFGGLTCGTTYTLGVVAFDAAGNRSSESTLSAATANCADTNPPTAPTGLAVTGTTTSTIALSWNASTDDVGVAGYDVYLDGSKIDTTTQTSYSFGGLTCGTTYTLGVVAFDAAGNRSSESTLTAASADCPASSGPCGMTTTHPTTYQHVIWIVFENHSYSEIIGSADAPYINSIASACGLATNFFAEGHPSLPNYIAMTSGSTQGISDDNGPSSHPLAVPSIFSQLPGGGSRSLEESMPFNCWGSDFRPYVVHHNPEAYYTNLGTDCANFDVPLGSPPDISAKFTFVTPNLCNDMHDCSVATGDGWLSTFLPAILGSPQYQSGSTAVFITWDEDDQSEGNHIATIVVSPSTPVGARSATAYNHYSMLRTSEELLGIGTFLGNAASATSMRSAFGL